MDIEALKKVFVWTVMLIFILNGKAYITEGVQPEAAASAGAGPDTGITGPSEKLYRECKIKARLLEALELPDLVLVGIGEDGKK